MPERYTCYWCAQPCAEFDLVFVSNRGNVAVHKGGLCPDPPEPRGTTADNPTRAEAALARVRAVLEVGRGSGENYVRRDLIIAALEEPGA